LRPWSGLAASGNAECRYHRANAQDVPHRLAISIIPHSGQSLLTSLGRNFCSGPPFKGYRRGGFSVRARMEATMHSVIYVICLIVVVLLLLSFLGLR
jgi:hypothetical protein